MAHFVKVSRAVYFLNVLYNSAKETKVPIQKTLQTGIDIYLFDTVCSSSCLAIAGEDLLVCKISYSLKHVNATLILPWHLLANIYLELAVGFTHKSKLITGKPFIWFHSDCPCLLLLIWNAERNKG